MSNVIEILDSDDDNQITQESSPCNVIDQNDDRTAFQSEIIDESINVARNRRRRKSGHQAIKESDDYSFVTIALDDDEENCPTSSQTTSKGQKPSTFAILDRAFDEFITDKEIDAKLKKIAEERVRINCILNCYGMPEILFDLYNQNENLMTQFNNCLEQYKISEWEMRRLQELKEMKQRQSVKPC